MHLRAILPQVDRKKCRVVVCLLRKDVPMDKEKIGKFISQNRKEKEMTQKDLAEQLHVTDKAVSKWERGMCFPDISMIEPLAKLLDVSVLELLEGERIDDDLSMNKDEAQKLISESIMISDDEISRKHIRSKTIILLITLFAMLLISFVLNILNYRRAEKKNAISVHSRAYETTVDENGNIVFVNSDEALEQLLQDLGKNASQAKEVE